MLSAARRVNAMTNRYGFLGAVALVGVVAVSACKRGENAASSGSETPGTGSATAGSTPTAPSNNVVVAPGTAGAGTPTALPTPPPPPTASGPHAQLTGEHHVLSATLAAPTAVPGDANLVVEVHGASGYHVNNLYPVALDLQATNATAPAQLRRANVAQLTQEVASFHVPVHVTGAGALVTGTMRFAVCSEQNCVPQSQAFAVNLPQ